MTIDALVVAVTNGIRMTVLFECLGFMYLIYLWGIYLDDNIVFASWNDFIFVDNIFNFIQMRLHFYLKLNFKTNEASKRHNSFISTASAEFIGCLFLGQFLNNVFTPDYAPKYLIIISSLEFNLFKHTQSKHTLM